MKDIKIRYFVDMDGTLAKFNDKLKSEEELYEKGYFRNLPSQPNLLKVIKDLAIRCKKDVFILSCYLADSPFALLEKKEWLKEHIPEIPESNWIFVPCGENKADYVPNGIIRHDILIDDYGENIMAWQKACKQATYIKVCRDLKDVRKENKKMKDKRCMLISPDMSTEEIESKISLCASNNLKIKEEYK